MLSIQKFFEVLLLKELLLSNVLSQIPVWQFYKIGHDIWDRQHSHFFIIDNNMRLYFFLFIFLTPSFSSFLLRAFFLSAVLSTDFLEGSFCFNAGFIPSSLIFIYNNMLRLKWARRIQGCAACSSYTIESCIATPSSLSFFLCPFALIVSDVQAQINAISNAYIQWPLGLRVIPVL